MLSSSHLGELETLKLWIPSPKSQKITERWRVDSVKVFDITQAIRYAGILNFILLIKCVKGSFVF